MLVSHWPLDLASRLNWKTNGFELVAESAFEAAPVLQEDELVQSGTFIIPERPFSSGSQRLI